MKVRKSFDKIAKSDEGFFSKYGSFFYEFKNTNRIISSYYIFFLVRRMIYALNQVFLAEFSLIQAGINIFVSFTFLCYLFIIRPFNDSKTQILNISSELCILLVFCSVFGMIYDSSIPHFAVETTIIVIILGFVAFQIVIAIITFVISLKLVLKKLRDHKKTRISYIVRQ